MPIGIFGRKYGCVWSIARRSKQKKGYRELECGECVSGILGESEEIKFGFKKFGTWQMWKNAAVAGPQACR